MADEIKTAQTNPSEQNNAPKESTDQQQAQKIIAENSAAQGTPNPTPGGAATVQEAAKPMEQPAAGQTTPQAAAQTPPAQPATPADRPATKEDAPRADRDKTPIEKQDAQTAENKAEAAKAAGVEMLKLVVDGVEVEVPKGTLVIEACFRAGADVPYFCYHPRLTSVGACRMCLASVELEMFGQRRASIMTCCTVPAAEGMVIKTNTPDVKKAQNGILEFLLANHPLDCPICDRGGECPLQNMTIAYGPPTSRFIEEKRHFPKAMPISDYVVLDRERCIQCMRCTRFTEEISGDGQLSLLNRGASSEIGPFFGTDFNSNFSGNTIEICPVGALTSRSYRFRGRPWEVKSVDSVCSRCGNGCNIAVQHRLSELVRINGRTNEEINEEWTCDRGKFGQYYVNDENRITRPLMRVGEELVPISWDGALRAIVDKINEIKSASGPDAIGGIASTRCTLEENYLFAKMMRAVIGTNNVDHQMRPYPFEPMQTSIAEIEKFKTIVSVGMKLDVDQPIVYLRVFKAKSKKNAEWIQTERFDDTAKAALERARGDAVLLVPHDLDPVELGSAKAFCRVVGAKLNVLLPDCNSWGAPLAGASPGLLPGMKGFADAQSHVEGQWGVSLPTGVGGSTDLMLNGAAEGKVQMLYVMGSDPAAKYINPELAKQAMATAFVVVQDMFLTETARYANIVLPACSFAEKDGTFVNIEGREQKIRQAFPPRGDSLPDWRILSDLMSRMGTIVPYFSARDIYREYRRAIPV
jgi:NADH-quinone oxidoreductase subunit G